MVDIKINKRIDSGVTNTENNNSYKPIHDEHERQNVNDNFKPIESGNRFSCLKDNNSTKRHGNNKSFNRKTYNDRGLTDNRFDNKQDSFKLNKKNHREQYPNDRFNQNDFSQRNYYSLNSNAEGKWFNRDGRHHMSDKESEIFGNLSEKSKGINFDSYDKIDVQISGEGFDSIVPLESFKDSNHEISTIIIANIERVKYDKLTPVQKYGIPILLSGKDLMACAQTGSGKTAAFLFPIIVKMMNSGPPQSLDQSNTGKPVAIVISPTRELTLQIGEEGRKFAFNTGIRTVVIYGGCDTRSQIFDIMKGCDICIATPGRLIDIISRRRIILNYVQYLVLDEADRMLDMGFSPQIMEIVLKNSMPSETRQTAMFSATFPKEIQELAATFMKNYIYLTVGRVGSTSSFIKQTFNYAEEHTKPKKLLQLLENADGRVLVFVETKRRADVIEDYLNHANLKAVSIHGDKTQQERTAALDLFKKGLKTILVATDVASRGLDIHSIKWVINLDLPHNIDEYVHRIGRTGRAGNAGLATSFVNEENKAILRPLISLLQEANQEVPNWLSDLSQACSSVHSKGFGSNRYHKLQYNNNNIRSTFANTDYRQQYESKNYNSNSRNNNNSNIRQADTTDCW